jgi:FkbM family methyltransferase
MRLKAALKDWRRRRQLARAGIAVELERPVFAAGARSGVWVVDPGALAADSVVYSFGVGDNVAWDLAMIERFSCTVHAFDPTPRAIDWVRSQRLPASFWFHPVGLAAFDGTQRFLPPAATDDVNFRPTADPLAIAVPASVRRLSTIARELGHDCIDVLKLDIEGGEYDVLPDLLRHGPRPTQLLLEFHHGQHGVPFAATRAAIAQLRAERYRILHVSRRGLEFSFIRS